MDESIEKRIGKEIDNIKKVIVEAITPDGLVPEIDERIKDVGFNSEMLGYALRIAVESDDKELFLKLKLGADQMKMENGLYKARLSSTMETDTSRGSTWADANQDIALSLIEAGQRWGDEKLVEEGSKVAESFYNNQVVVAGDMLVPLQNTKDEEERVTGREFRRVNPSMYNFKLYEKMVGLSGDNGEKWHRLEESGVKLLKGVLEVYKLPPDSLNLIGGKIVTNEDLVRGVSSGLFTEHIPDSAVEAIKAIPGSSELSKSITGYDAMRIPFRLEDSSLPETAKIAMTIHDRLDLVGGAKTKHYSVSGEPHLEGESAAVVEAPLSVTSAKAMGNKDKALGRVMEKISSVDKKVLYWQLWRALGLIQLKEATI